jgi:hypothetical protein
MLLFQQIDSRTFVHRVDLHGRLCSVNRAWLDFAAENGWPITSADIVGRPLMDYIADTHTRYLYGMMLTRLRHGHGPISFEYRCDAPDCRRHMQMRIIADHAAREIEFQNRILHIERRSAQPLWQPQRPRTAHPVDVCSFCKRVDTGQAWVEVEDAVMHLRLFDCDRLPQVRQRVCSDCSGKLGRIAEHP